MAETIAPLTAIQLRLIAEAASGFRGQEVWFVPEKDGSIRIEHTAPEEGVFAIPSLTADDTRMKPVVTLAQLGVKGSEPIDLLNLGGNLGPGDSAFWTQSAVEKFLVPYYAAVYGGQSARAVADLLDVFRGDELDGGVRVYGLVHLPRSEYVMLSDPAGDAMTREVGLDVAVAFVDFGTEPARAGVLSLNDFLRAYRRG